GAIINGLIFRNINIDNNVNMETQPSLTENPLDDSMVNSLVSILSVGGYISIAYLLCDMITQILPTWFHTDGQLITAYLLGIIEMTNGCIQICGLTDIFTSTVLCCSLISFGGLCVLMQTMIFLGKCKIKTKSIVAIKLTHCALSTILCFILGKIFI
ncbi:MAG: hypothetical protein NC350_05395, partial [Corallococcus sp.]|nr:hypothetical protein [Corallococcus sp.]